MTNTSVNQRILKCAETNLSIGISKSTNYARRDPKSKQYDPHFPTPIKLSATSIGWLESEVQGYIQHLITTSRPTV